MDGHLTDPEILKAWEINTNPWIKAIENNEIESRLLVTNQAIIDKILASKPNSVLDIGCGEGWLAAKLAEKGIDVSGIDAIPKLVEKARHVSGKFEVCTYENLASHKFDRKFDSLVCNFALIGEKSTECVIKAAGKLLEPGGNFIIQTLHPVAACGDAPYADGWREGSWAGFSSAFTTPAPWYFRTIETWKKLFAGNGLNLKSVMEPIHPKTGKPASIIFELVAN